MADFRRRRSFKSKKPQLMVDGGLPVGTHVFHLEVEDERGKRSKAAHIKLKIVAGRAPLRPGPVNPPGVIRRPATGRTPPEDS
jgi:hypothetical protein